MDSLFQFVLHFLFWVMDSLIRLELGIGATFSIMGMDALNRLVRFWDTFVIIGLLATLIFVDMTCVIVLELHALLMV